MDMTLSPRGGLSPAQEAMKALRAAGGSGCIVSAPALAGWARSSSGTAAMSPPSEDKLLSFLAEIRSDIRQIKSDLQALLTLLKQQQATPAAFSEGDPVAEPTESGRSGSPEDLLRYLRETREDDDTGE